MLSFGTLSQVTYACGFSHSQCTKLRTVTQKTRRSFWRQKCTSSTQAFYALMWKCFHLLCMPSSQSGATAKSLCSGIHVGRWTKIFSLKTPFVLATTSAKRSEGLHSLVKKAHLAYTGDHLTILSNLMVKLKVSTQSNVTNLCYRGRVPGRYPYHPWQLSSVHRTTVLCIL